MNPPTTSTTPASAAPSGAERARPSGKAQGRLAGIDARAGGARIVTVEFAGRPAVVDARVIPDASPAAISAALKELGVTRAVRVAPASRCVSRAEPVPDAADAELRSAVLLLGEAMLPEDVPPHRRAAGVLGSPAGRFVLLTAWRGEESGPGLSGVAESWIAEPAALGVLGMGRATLMASAHAADRSLSVIAAGASRVVARTVVLGGSGDDWHAGVARTIADTCRAAGTTPEAGPDGDGASLDPAGRMGAMGIVAGVRDAAWISQFGLALGAALAGGSADPMVAGLASLTRSDQSEKPSAVVRAAAWVGKPRNALVTLGVAAALLLLSPLAIAYARLGVLSMKTAPIEEAAKSSVETARKAAMYRELTQTRPPLTKLMADLSAATPVGVIVDSMSLTSEPDFKLSITGTADSFEILNQLGANLNKTGIFENVAVSKSDTTASGVTFDLVARISSPTIASRPIDDFIANPLVKRLYGENGSSLARHTPSAEPEHDAAETHAGETDTASRPSPPPRSNPDGGFRRNNGRGNGTGRPSGRTNEISPGVSPTKAGEAPAELTDEQIAAMNLDQATREMGTRKGASYKSGIDAATKARLEAEVKKLQDRRKALESAKPPEAPK